MKTEHDHDDLIVLARRGDLSQADERRVQDLLAASPEARELYDAGRAFDGEAAVMPGDDMRVARIVRGVERQLRAARAPQKRWVVRTLLVAALITSGAVGAVELTKQDAPAVKHEPAAEPERAPAVTVRRHGGRGGRAMPAIEAEQLAVEQSEELAADDTASGTEDTAPSPNPSPNPSPSPSPSPNPSPNPSPSPSPSPNPSPNPKPSPHPLAKAHHARTEAAAPAAPPEPEVVAAPAVEPPPAVTAATLFSGANQARVAGDLDRAIALSHQLIDQFPTSREAIATHQTLGLMYLQRHDAASSLDELRRYLAVAPQGTQSEALWGEAQALEQLGRAGDERAVLEQLVRDYPASAYVAAARKRLAALP